MYKLDEDNVVKEENVRSSITSINNKNSHEL